jgi:hypothetical protein
LIEDV